MKSPKNLLLASAAVVLFGGQAEAIEVTGTDDILELTRALNLGFGFDPGTGLSDGFSPAGIRITGASIQAGAPGGGGPGGGGPDTTLGLLSEPGPGGLPGSIMETDDDSSPFGNGLASLIGGTVGSSGQLSFGVSGFADFDFDGFDDDGLGGEPHDQFGDYSFFVGVGSDDPNDFGTAGEFGEFVPDLDLAPGLELFPFLGNLEGDDADFYDVNTASGEEFVAFTDNSELIFAAAEGAAVQSVNGGPSPIGTFTNDSGTYDLPENGGIVLSSGDVEDYGDGPNLNTGNTTSFGNVATPEQEALLDPITGELDHFDVIQFDITFDVASGFDVLSFLGAFGSDEFPEFLGGGVTDGFGMFLNEVNIAGVNGFTVNIEHPDMAEIPGTELDGVLAPGGDPLLRFDGPVVPGSTGNTLTFILSDSGDDIIDTTAYIAQLAAAGASEDLPSLPDNVTDDGDFEFELPPVPPGTIIWIDPDVAIGYTFEITGGNSFASVTMPSLASVNDTDGYLLSVFDGIDFVSQGTFLAGDTFDFTTLLLDVTRFRIEDIDPALLLDPTDPLAFQVGITLTATPDSDDLVTMSPITTFVAVPEPPSYAVVLTGLFVAGFFRRVRGRRLPSGA